jgi:hypothetical protein
MQPETAPIRPLQRRFKLFTGLGVLIALTLCCGESLWLARRAAQSQPVYPGAVANQAADPSCHPLDPTFYAGRYGLTVGLDTNACLVTADTPSQVLTWYQQAGWGLGGKCACVVRGSDHHLDFGAWHIQVYLFTEVYAFTQTAGRGTVILQRLGGYANVNWP